MRTASRELSALRARVAAWRREGGGRGSRIPDALWDEAVRVARVDGLYATAQAAHFNYERLKARSRKEDGSAQDQARALTRVARAERRTDAVVATRKTRARAEVTAGARFLTLPVAPTPSDRRTVIELVGRHGDRMRVEVSSDVEVTGLVHAFWSRAS